MYVSLLGQGGRRLRVVRGLVGRGILTRAAVCEDLESGTVKIRDDWNVEGIEKKGMVHIEAKCAGINFGELLQLRGQYQEKLEPPFVPGNEVSGIVKEIGPGVEKVAVGDAVVALPRGGGWARDIILPESHVFGLGLAPSECDFASAAALSICYGTANMALVERARIKAGETVVVTAAAGGVGLATVEIARHLGARVIACASDQKKLDIAFSKGASAGLVYNTKTLQEADNAKKFRTELQGICPHGIDVVIDMLGDPCLNLLVRSLNFGGRAVVVGFAGGQIPKIPANILLVKHVSVHGLYWGATLMHDSDLFLKNTNLVNEAWRQSHFRPHVSNRFPLQDANLAIQAILSRKTTGKVVLDLS